MIYKNVILYKIQLKQFVRLPENSLKRLGQQVAHSTLAYFWSPLNDELKN